MTFNLVYHAGYSMEYLRGLSRRDLIELHRVLVDQLDAEKKAAQGK